MNGFMITSEGFVIAIVSVGLALMSIIVRKLVLDQNKVKAQREQLKEYQKEMKEAQKSGDSKKMSEMYSKMMEINSEVMKQSFKPMIFTLIPFLLVFSWMRGAYDPTMTEVVLINPFPEGAIIRDVSLSGSGVYNSTANALVWKEGMVAPGNSSILSAEFRLDEGGIESLGQPAVLYHKSASGSIMEPISSNKTDSIVLLKSLEEEKRKIRITLFYNNTKSNIVSTLAGLELGWFGWYFISSMVASLALNKIFKVS